MALFILIELLLVFGDTFSKFSLWGPFHLYDAALIILGIISFVIFFLKKEKFWVWPVIVILGISILYVPYSYFLVHNPSNYIIRQYALFIYLGLGWIIFSSFINKEFHNYNIRFIALFGIGAIGIQVIYTIYLALFTNDFSLFGNFNYYSKMAVVGIIVFGAYILIYIKKPVSKWALIAFYILLSMTLGHSSAFLAAFTVVISYIILQLPKKIKIAGLILLIIFVLVFFLYLPQFSDQNAEWRLVFWKYSLKDIIQNYYTIFGHGFGVPYPTSEALVALRENVNSPWFEMRPEEMYLSPMHNSFITLAFHIGLLPSLLIFVPLYKPLKNTVLTPNKDRDRNADFLLLSLIGLFVWSSFNVILELPHSSAFIWLVYFSLIYQFRLNKTSNA